MKRNLIADYRKEHGMTQTEFAQKLGVTQQMLSYYENGMPPSLDFIKAFKKITGIDLIFGKNGPVETDQVDSLQKENALLRNIIEEQKKRLDLYEKLIQKKIL